MRIFHEPNVNLNCRVYKQAAVPTQLFDQDFKLDGKSYFINKINEHTRNDNTTTENFNRRNWTHYPMKVLLK